MGGGLSPAYVQLLPTPKPFSSMQMVRKMCPAVTERIKYNPYGVDHGCL